MGVFYAQTLNMTIKNYFLKNKNVYKRKREKNTHKYTAQSSNCYIQN